MAEKKDDKPEDADREAQERALRVEQDNRVAQVKAEAEEKAAGSRQPEKGVNPDG